MKYSPDILKTGTNRFAASDALHRYDHKRSEMVEPMKNMTRGKGSEPSKPFMKSLMTYLMARNERFSYYNRIFVCVSKCCYHIGDS